MDRKERKEIRQRLKIKYFSLWVEYKGKKLRILIGVKRVSAFDDLFTVAFAYQSPKEPKENLIEAKKEVRSNMRRIPFEWNKAFRLPKEKISPDNLIVLALAYPILIEDVSWMKHAHVLYAERTQ